VSLSTENPVSKFAFKCDLYRCTMVEQPLLGGAVGRCKLNPAETHSLKAPGFNPSAWSVSEYIFGVRTSKLTRYLGVKSFVRTPKSTENRPGTRAAYQVIS
jgi:hypothetical protein